MFLQEKSFFAAEETFKNSMLNGFKKAIVIFSLAAIFPAQCVLAQDIRVFDISKIIDSGQAADSRAAERYKPAQLKFVSYNTQNNNFEFLLDQGDARFLEDKSETEQLLKYFFIGLSIPNEGFWVNLKPDSPEEMVDGFLAKTDIGRVLLEADLQLKEDTARYSSFQTPEGRQYWDSLYAKAKEIYGQANIKAPILIRPWIVPDEIILQEDENSVYIFHAGLKVLLNPDNIIGSKKFAFADQKSKEINDYAADLFQKLILPKLNYEINNSKRYSRLRQVYYSLILSQWFKQAYRGKRLEASLDGLPIPGREAVKNIIDTKNLAGLISKESWDKNDYYKAYHKSFTQGGYNLSGQSYDVQAGVIKRSFLGGIDFTNLVGGIKSSLDKFISKYKAGSNFSYAYELRRPAGSAKEYIIRSIVSSFYSANEELDRDRMLNVLGQVLEVKEPRYSKKNSEIKSIQMILESIKKIGQFN